MGDGIKACYESQIEEARQEKEAYWRSLDIITVMYEIEKVNTLIKSFSDPDLRLTRSQWDDLQKIHTILSNMTRRY